MEAQRRCRESIDPGSIAIDMTAVFYSSRQAAKHMRANGYGRIVTIASIAGKEGVPYIAAYSAAKAGVIGFTKSAALEVAQQGRQRLGRAAGLLGGGSWLRHGRCCRLGRLQVQLADRGSFLPGS